MAGAAMQCPLCHTDDAPLFHEDARRTYHRCGTCRLVFVPPQYFLPRDQERAHYDLHENDPADERYRAFLDRLCSPLLQRIAPGSGGLDFGSGPGPTLSVMLQEAGHRVDLFDPAYADNSAVFEKRYDFITASEVVEHLHDPAGWLQRLWDCLRPGGVLGVMTKLVSDPAAFADWHYIRDPTHVCFFSTQTFEWLADRWTARHEQVAADVTLLTRPK
jgi:SAM-dependent methyltransferase